jgi:hypothetical protein
MCQQLGAPVKASWNACSLALPPFAPSWETLEDSWSLPEAKLVLEAAHSLAAVADNTAVVPIEEIVSLTPEAAKAVLI